MAGTRTLGLLRSTIGPEVDVEGVVPLREMLDLNETDDELVVEFVPTGFRAEGYAEVKEMYGCLWGGERPVGWKWVVERRTVGVETVVDEVKVEFWHDREVRWCLPGVGATGRKVEIGRAHV